MKVINNRVMVFILCTIITTNIFAAMNDEENAVDLELIRIDTKLDEYLNFIRKNLDIIENNQELTAINRFKILQNNSYILRKMIASILLYGEIQFESQDFLRNLKKKWVSYIEILNEFSQEEFDLKNSKADVNKKKLLKKKLELFTKIKKFKQGFFFTYHEKEFLEKKKSQLVEYLFRNGLEITFIE